MHKISFKILNEVMVNFVQHVCVYVCVCIQVYTDTQIVFLTFLRAKCTILHFTMTERWDSSHFSGITSSWYSGPLLPSIQASPAISMYASSEDELKHLLWLNKLLSQLKHCHTSAKGKIWDIDLGLPSVCCEYHWWNWWIKKKLLWTIAEKGRREIGREN